MEKRPVKALSSLEEFDGFLLQLGNTFCVTRALVGEKRNLAGTLFDFLDKQIHLVSALHNHIDQAFFLTLTQLDGLFDATDARQFTPHLTNLSGQCFPCPASLARSISRE